MKLLLILVALLFGVIVTGMTLLQNGSLQHYLDTHPEVSWVPAADYYIGEGYYIMGNLEASATYYQRVADRFPNSSYAEDGYFNYLQAVDDMNVPRMEMVNKYSEYLERFPNGSHAEVTRRRIENYRNSRH